MMVFARSLKISPLKIIVTLELPMKKKIGRVHNLFRHLQRMQFLVNHQIKPLEDKQKSEKYDVLHFHEFFVN